MDRRSKKLVWFLAIAAIIGFAAWGVFLTGPGGQAEPEAAVAVETTAAPAPETTAETVLPETEQTVPETEATEVACIQPETTEADANLPDFVEAYIQIIQETEKKENTVNYKPQGQLHDMNGDGIPELVFFYDLHIPEMVTYGDGTREEVPLTYCVCDLYTYYDGEVVQLLDQEKVFSAFGAETSLGAFAEIDGKECFVLRGYGGPTGVGYSDKCQGLDADSLGDYTEGYIKLYTLSGTKLRCRTNVQYRYHSYAKNSNFSGTKNGTSITEAEYRKWLSNLPPIRWFNGWGSISAEDLQTMLKENTWAQVGAGEQLWVNYPVESVSTSSVYTGDNRNHGASNLLDGDPQTNWTEGAKGNGAGEWIQFRFKGRYQLDSISICGGCRVDEAHYYDNARPEKVTLTFSDGSSLAYTLNDNERLSEQYIRFDAPVITDSVKITIDSVYPGEKYEDIVISDVFFGAYTVE